MAEDNNIKNFRATDIEKYLKGQLSPGERHAIERAALDDPFLADALEGYSVPGVNVSNDIEELNKRLADKTEQAKVIPMTPARSSFPWLRAAIVTILVAGAGTLAYFVLSHQSTGEKDIAKSAPANQPAKTPGQMQTLPETVKADSPRIKSPETNKNKTEPGKSTTDGLASSKLNEQRADSIQIDYYKKSSIELPKADRETTRNSDDIKQQNTEFDKKSVAVTKPLTNVAPLAKAGVPGRADSTIFNNDKEQSDFFAQTPAIKKDEAASPKRKVSNYIPTNVFKGTVTDATNTPLPFANITNRRDNVGTYSDAQGNFTLVSPDSVLDVQVKSLGFENNNVQLRTSAPTTRITLQEDRSMDARILDTAKHNISRARNKTMTFEEPEPEDGWPAYKSYVLNNLNMPEKIEMKKSGEVSDNTVEVSFEVNNNGDPVKIRVEKSLCDQCDKEAIRLIKDGPKWKRKGKKGKRTTVTVPFIKTD